jgi:hypothetical protein
MNWWSKEPFTKIFAGISWVEEGVKENSTESSFKEMIFIFLTKV